VQQGANTLDTMWGTDVTTTITGEGQAAVFVALDHYSAECVGILSSGRQKARVAPNGSKLDNVLRRVHPNLDNLVHGRYLLSEISNDLILAHSMPPGAVHIRECRF
jgi:hypothetical protein